MSYQYMELNIDLSIYILWIYRTPLLDDAASERVPLKPELTDNNTRCTLEYQPNNKEENKLMGNKTNTLVVSYEVERDGEENEIQVQICLCGLSVCLFVYLSVCLFVCLVCLRVCV